MPTCLPFCSSTDVRPVSARAPLSITMGASAVHGEGGAAAALEADALADATGAGADALGAADGAGGTESLLEQPAMALTASTLTHHTHEIAAFFILDPSLDGRGYRGSPGRRRLLLGQPDRGLSEGAVRHVRCSLASGGQQRFGSVAEDERRVARCELQGCPGRPAERGVDLVTQLALRVA